MTTETCLPSTRKATSPTGVGAVEGAWRTWAAKRTGSSVTDGSLGSVHSEVAVAAGSLASAKPAAWPKPATVAVAVKLPTTVLATTGGAVATPLSSVVNVTVRGSPEPASKRAEGPLPGSVKVTARPGIGAPSLAVTRACSRPG